jgi:hypothetical protein
MSRKTLKVDRKKFEGIRAEPTKHQAPEALEGQGEQTQA